MVEYNPRRWSDHMVAIHGSVAPKITTRILVVVAWSVIVVLYHQFVHRLDIPATVHNLVGLALGLLLVFRTNSSYERFWEGRKTWGGIVNDCRNLARGARTLFAPDDPIVEPLVRWAAAFPYACMHLLRQERSLGPAAARLPPDAVAAILADPHPPSAVAARISELLGSKRDDNQYQGRVVVHLDRLIQSLVNGIGECERIRNTPLPFAYVVHLRRALVLYLLTMPLVLLDSFGWTTPLCMLLISYILLGIEEIGVEIENPFGTDSNDLPLEALCATIVRDLHPEDAAPPLQPQP
jgi:ion channel-forming bestrophin family protein